MLENCSEALKQDYDSKMAALKEQMNGVEAQIADFETQITQLTEELEQAKAEEEQQKLQEQQELEAMKEAQNKEQPDKTEKVDDENAPEAVAKTDKPDGKTDSKNDTEKVADEDTINELNKKVEDVQNRFGKLAAGMNIDDIAENLTQTINSGEDEDIAVDEIERAENLVANLETANNVKDYQQAFESITGQSISEEDVNEILGLSDEEKPQLTKEEEILFDEIQNTDLDQMIEDLKKKKEKVIN